MLLPRSDLDENEGLQCVPPTPHRTVITVDHGATRYGSCGCDLNGEDLCGPDAQCEEGVGGYTCAYDADHETFVDEEEDDFQSDDDGSPQVLAMDQERSP
ncbi:unnamed protein product [Ascophyllum nodosum]